MGIGDMRPALQLGSLIVTILWVVAIVTPSWHEKTYIIGLPSIAGGAIADLKLNLYSYSWECRETPKPTWSFAVKFCGGSQNIIGEGMLTELMAHMCAVEEQSFGLLRMGCDQVSMVAVVSMVILILLMVTLILNVCGAVMLQLDPSSRTVNVMYTSAPIVQFLGLAAYIGVTYDLSGFMDTDQATDRIGDAAGGITGALFGADVGNAVNGAVDVGGKLAMNDLDHMPTFRYSFFIAVAAMVCQSILAWMMCLFVADVRDRELFADAKNGMMPAYGATDPYAQQQWQQQQQQGWGQQQQQQQQQWQQPQQQQWQQPQQGWGQQGW